MGFAEDEEWVVPPQITAITPTTPSPPPSMPVWNSQHQPDTHSHSILEDWDHDSDNDSLDAFCQLQERSSTTFWNHHDNVSPYSSSIVVSPSPQPQLEQVTCCFKS